MNRTLRSLADRLTGLALLLLMAAPIALAVYYARNRLEAAEADIATLAERYDRVRAIASFDPAPLEQSDARALAAEYVLGDGPASVETSALQARLRELAVSQGLEILQASEVQIEAGGSPIEKLGVRLELSGPAGGILRFLAAIETAKPWLFADNLQVRTGYADGLLAQSEPPMALGLDVWGVRIAAETPAAATP